MKWYHTYLLPFGLGITKAIFCQHLYWPGIRKSVQKEVTNCDVYQRTKQLTKKGKLPAKLAEETQWNKLCVDIIGPYIIRKKRERVSNLKILYNDRPGSRVV